MIAVRPARMFLTAALVALAASPAFAITWCHDYSLWEASGRTLNQNQTSPGMLRQKLGQMQYHRMKVFAPKTADADRYLKPGDVIILGEAHSGFVTAQGVVDHLIMPSAAPGTQLAQMTGEQAQASANFKRGWTLTQLWGPIVRFDSQGNRYDNAPYGNASVELWRKVQVRQTFAGALAKGQPKDRLRKNCYVQVHTVTLNKYGLYLLDLESGNGQAGAHNPGFFDTWLRIEDANGTVLESNDDGGDGLNSRIYFAPPADGVYRLIVTSFRSEATGSYVLKIRS